MIENLKNTAVEPKPMTASEQKTPAVKEDGKEQLNAEITEALIGSQENESPQKLDTITPNERKALIKYYQEQGYSKKEAEELFESKADKIDKMSRKEAKKWCKEYMEKNRCSKKEAREAFKQEFGYSVPLSAFQKTLRLSAINNPIGIVVGIADSFANGKLGFKKFFTGQGNNDAAYVRKNQDA